MSILWGLCGLHQFILLVADLVSLRNAILVNSKLSVIVFFVLNAVASVCFTVLGISKALHFEAFLIGRNVLTTLLFCCGSFFTWNSAILFVKTLSDFYSSKLSIFPKGEKPVLAFRFRLLVAFNAVGSFSPLGCLALPSECATFGLSFYIFDAVMSIFLGIHWSRHFTESLLEDLAFIGKSANRDEGHIREVTPKDSRYERLAHGFAFSRPKFSSKQ